MNFVKIFLTVFSFFTLTFSNAQCNTDITICEPGVAGPFGWVNASANPSSCLDYLNGSNTPSYAYVILYITQGGQLRLLIDGVPTDPLDVDNGCLDVAIFDITGVTDPCSSLSSTGVATGETGNSSNSIPTGGTQLSCNYASDCDGCSEFGNAFPGCESNVAAPTVSAGDVVMILVEDYTNNMSGFTLELATTNGSAETGPADPTITPAGPFLNTDPTQTMTAVNGGGTWTSDCGACIDPLTGVFDPGVAGNGTHEICYTISTGTCFT